MERHVGKENKMKKFLTHLKKRVINHNEKVGIITFHCAENYGAFLQCFALKKWVEKRMGNYKEVNVINYRPQFLILPYRIRKQLKIDKNWSVIKKCKILISFLAIIPYRCVRKLKYRKAEQLLSLTKPFRDNDIVIDDSYNMLILGSDQIWNTNLTHGVDKAYFGAIAPENCIKISYAASVGVTEYPEEIKYKIKKYISDLDSIGVREKESITLLKQICSKAIELNIDPTMLVPPSFWTNYIKYVKYDNYILVYSVASDSRMMQDAYNIAKKYRMMILHFGDPSLKSIFGDVKVKSISFCGPFDFISYIAKASVILTDSFHATCFSVIFSRNFYTYLQSSRSERLRTLANIGGFSNRLLECGHRLTSQNLESVFNGNTENYNCKYETVREQSENYLIRNLERII